MKCLIVDDELMARKYLEKLCAKMPVLDLVGSCASAKEAMEVLQKEPIDILFLDVEMPGLSGLELLNQLPFLPKVIMTTSKTEYAFDAFQYQAVDYLKKPINFPRFRQAIEKILESEETVGQTTSAAAPVQDEEVEEIFIKDNNRLTKITLKDILYIENIGDYVKIITKDDQYTIYGTIKGIAAKLPEKNFLKVHRSYIINMKEIVDVEANSILIDKKLIPVSRAHKQQLFDRLKLLN